MERDTYNAITKKIAAIETDPLASAKADAEKARGFEMRSYSWNGTDWEWNGDGWPVGENMSREGDFSAYGEGEDIRLAVWDEEEELVQEFFGVVREGQFVLGN